MIKKSFDHRTANLLTNDTYVSRARVFSAWDLPRMYRLIGEGYIDWYLVENERNFFHMLALT